MDDEWLLSGVLGLENVSSLVIDGGELATGSISSQCIEVLLFPLDLSYLLSCASSLFYRPSLFHRMIFLPSFLFLFCLSLSVVIRLHSFFVSDICLVLLIPVLFMCPPQTASVTLFGLIAHSSSELLFHYRHRFDCHTAGS